jgi:hypothetical protein
MLVRWRKYGINGKTAVHEGDMDAGLVISWCGRQVPADYMSEPTGWAPWATAMRGVPLPPDLKWQVADPVSCKACLKAMTKGGSSPRTALSL